jgi:hypothetical protein
VDVSLIRGADRRSAKRSRIASVVLSKLVQRGRDAKSGDGIAGLAAGSRLNAG